MFAESASNTGLSTFQTANNWSEASLQYNNRPTLGTMVGNPAPITARGWVEVDVTSVVPGPGTYAFALTTTSSTRITLTSSEGGANAPQIQFGSPPTSSRFDITRAGNTYTALSDLGVSYTGSLKVVGERAVADLMTAGGGTVGFAAGEYDFGQDFFKFEVVRNIAFVGAGKDATVIRNFTNAAADTEPFNFTTADNITVKDLTVQAGGSNRFTSDALDFDNGNNVTVENVKVTASRGRAIVFDGKNEIWSAEHNTVRNCEIGGAVPSDGIELLASGNNLIEGCRITNVGGHGIQFAKAAATADQPNKKSSANVVRNNTIDNAGQDGINLNGGDANRIEGNTITNSGDDASGRDGVRVGTGDGASCNDTVLETNTVTDNQATRPSDTELRSLARCAGGR